MDRRHRVTVEREPDPLDLAFLEHQLAEAALSAADVGDDDEDFTVFGRDHDRVVAGPSCIIRGGGSQVHSCGSTKRARVVASAERSWPKPNTKRGDHATGWSWAPPTTS